MGTGRQTMFALAATVWSAVLGKTAGRMFTMLRSLNPAASIWGHRSDIMRDVAMHMGPDYSSYEQSAPRPATTQMTAAQPRTGGGGIQSYMAPQPYWGALHHQA